MTFDAAYPSGTADRARHVAGLMETAEAPSIDGDLCALIVPHADHTDGGALTARVMKAALGGSYRSVIVMASGEDEVAGRIHVSRRETYPSAVGAIPVDLRSVDELCDEDDDIYADDRGHFLDEGIGVQLPFLREVLGDFGVVPVIMGDESPDICRELGAAVGEVMYNQPTLLVACVDVLSGDAEALDSFRSMLEAGDLDGMMRCLNSERVRLDGAGPLMAAVIAGQLRHARDVTVLELSGPSGGAPGRLGAVIARR